MNFLGRVSIAVVLVGCVFAQQTKQPKRSKLTVDKTYLGTTHDGGEQLSEVHYSYGVLYLTCTRGSANCHPLRSGRTYEWDEPPRTGRLNGVAVYTDPDCAEYSAFLPEDYHCVRIYDAGKFAAVYVAHLIRKAQPVAPPTLTEELGH